MSTHIREIGYEPYLHTRITPTTPYLFHDDFSDRDYTLNPVWNVDSGVWSAANSYLEKTANDGSWEAIHTVFGVDSGIWEFKLRGLGTALQTMQFYFMSKETTFQNAYFVYFPHGSINLYKTVGGSATSLGVYNHTTDGNWHDIKVTRDLSGNMKLYLDGTERISVNDTTVSGSTYMICRTPRLESFGDIRVSAI